MKIDKKIDRTKSNERKWDLQYLEQNYNIDFSKKYYNLSIADLDFQTPKAIVKAIKKRANKKTYSYTYSQIESIESIYNWYKKNHQITLKSELIKIVHGTVNAMFEVIKCFTNEQEAIIIQTPIYQPFERSILKTNRTVIYNQLIYKENNFYIDFNNFENQIIKNNIKLFLWCNPHNPGGRVWSAEEINKIIAICNKHNVLIFSDEVHGDLVLLKKHNSILNYANSINNFIVANSPNKAFNLGGLKGSYLICSNDEILEKITNQYEKDSLTSSNVFFQPALKAAYNSKNSFKWLQNLKKYILSNFIFLKSQLIDFKNIEIMDMDASYLVWIKLKSKLNWNEIKQKTYDNNLILSFAEEFADSQEGWLRINIGINRRNLQKVLIRFKNIIENI